MLWVPREIWRARPFWYLRGVKRGFLVTSLLSFGMAGTLSAQIDASLEPEVAASAAESGVISVMAFAGSALGLEAVTVSDRRISLVADGITLSGIVVDERGVVAIPITMASTDSRFAIRLGSEWRVAVLATVDAPSFTALLVVDTPTPMEEAPTETGALDPRGAATVSIIRAGGTTEAEARLSGDGRARLVRETPEDVGALVRASDGSIVGWTTQAPRETILRLASVASARELAGRSTAQLAQAQRSLAAGREWVAAYRAIESMLGARAVNARPTAEEVVAIARSGDASSDSFVHALTAGYLWNVALLTRAGAGIQDAPATVVEQCRTKSRQLATRVSREAPHLHRQSTALRSITGAPLPRASSTAALAVESPSAETHDGTSWFPLLWAGFELAPGSPLASGFSVGGLAPVWRSSGDRTTRVALGVGVGVDWLRALTSGVTVSELAVSLQLGASLRVGGELAFLGTLAWAPSLVVGKACAGECVSDVEARIGVWRLSTGLAWKRFAAAPFLVFLLPEAGYAADVRVGAQVGTSF